MGQILYAKSYRESLISSIKEDALSIINKTSLKPTLAVVIVGENPSSMAYVKQIEKTCNEVDINCKTIKLSDQTSEQDFISEIQKLNSSKEIHGIIIQSDLPKHIKKEIIPEIISPAKDIDGISPMNAGLLALGKNNGFAPCTSLAALFFAKTAVSGNLEGKKITIIGRSNIVGKPLLHLLLQENATVTICHSKTKNLQNEAANADVLIAAIGKAKFINETFVSEKNIVVDVGINFDENNKMCGDVDFEKVKDIVRAITPVPGGVGPITNIMLMKNTIKAAKQQLNLN